MPTPALCPTALWGHLLRWPRIVRSIDVDESLLRVELDLRQLFPGERVLPCVERRVRAPHFRRIVEVLRRSIAEGEAGADRLDSARMICVQHADVERVPLL